MTQDTASSRAKRPAEQAGFYSAKILDRFESMEQFDPSKYPAAFVLKPENYCSSAGVMVLQREGDLFRDLMSSDVYDRDTILQKQRQVAEKRAPEKPTYVVEEFIVAERPGIPFDYKVYQFYTGAGLILQIDRNVYPRQVAFFDSSFEPLPDSEFKLVNVHSMVAGETHVVPKNAKALLAAAQKLIEVIRTPFVSIDAYAGENGPVLGELTYVPGAPYYGAFQFSDAVNRKLGQMWTDSMSALGMELPLIEGFAPAQETPTPEQIAESEDLRNIGHEPTKKPAWPAPQPE